MVLETMYDPLAKHEIFLRYTPILKPLPWKTTIGKWWCLFWFRISRRRRYKHDRRPQVIEYQIPGRSL